MGGPWLPDYSPQQNSMNAVYLPEKKTKFTGMKHGFSKWLILCSKCTKFHLRASVVQKKFLGSLSLAVRGRENRGGERRGGEGRGVVSSTSLRGLDAPALNPGDTTGNVQCKHTPFLFIIYSKIFLENPNSIRTS
jgi:hypothetical protein